MPLAPNTAAAAPHSAGVETVSTHDLSTVAPPATQARRWTPQRVVATRLPTSTPNRVWPEPERGMKADHDDIREYGMSLLKYAAAAAIGYFAGRPGGRRQLERARTTVAKLLSSPQVDDVKQRGKGIAVLVEAV